ncbi:hypothetical protein CH300_04875 [Rhodococcus sp. 15-1154-1]|nr:hypothetical protein CH300_04875 [Rhodococcus sp. 15-1154-1]
MADDRQQCHHRVGMRRVASTDPRHELALTFAMWAHVLASELPVDQAADALDDQIRGANEGADWVYQQGIPCAPIVAYCQTMPQPDRLTVVDNAGESGFGTRPKSDWRWNRPTVRSHRLSFALLAPPPRSTHGSNKMVHDELFSAAVDSDLDKTRTR